MPIRTYACCEQKLSLQQPLLNFSAPACRICGAIMVWQPSNIMAHGIMFTNTMRVANMSLEHFLSESDIAAWKRENPNREISTNEDFAKVRNRHLEYADKIAKKRGFTGVEDYRHKVATGALRG